MQIYWDSTNNLLVFGTAKNVSATEATIVWNSTNTKFSIYSTHTQTNIIPETSFADVTDSGGSAYASKAAFEAAIAPFFIGDDGATDVSAITASVASLDTKEGVTGSAADVDGTRAQQLRFIGEEIVKNQSASLKATHWSPADGTVAFTSTTTVTCSSFNFIVDDANCNIVLLQKKTVAGDISLLRHGVNGVTISSSANVVTVTGADDFLVTDTFEISINQQEKGYDIDFDSIKFLLQNPEYKHRTDVDPIIDEVNVASGTYRKQWFMGDYTCFSLHLNGSGGVTFTIWASNKSTADETADTDWVDVSTEIMGVVSLVDSEDIFFVDTPKKPLKFMVKYVTSDATNAVDADLILY